MNLVTTEMGKYEVPMPGDHGNEVMTSHAKQATLSENSSRSERNFPVRLWDLLNSLEAEMLTHVVGWSPHGRCFVIRNQEEFVRSILPVWFRQTKFTSFQRQLNIYGFTRLTAGKDKHGYYHPLFLRNDRTLVKKIERHKLKGTGTRKPGEPDKEPNFYCMPYIPAPPKGGSASTSSAMYTHLSAPQTRPSVATDISMESSYAPLYQNHLAPSSTTQGSIGQLHAAGLSSAHLQPQLSWQEILRLASAQRSISQFYSGYIAPPFDSSQFDILLADARCSASLANANYNFRLPGMGEISNTYSLAGRVGSTNIPPIEDPRVLMLQNLLRSNDTSQLSRDTTHLSRDALHRALLQSSLTSQQRGI